jgi:starch phosphorylase
MKLALNGALTIGTWDGANIEMAQAMGADNMFVFGLRTHEAQRVRELGYDPRLYVEENRQLQRVMHAIGAGDFSLGNVQRYKPLVQSLLGRDHYLLMADFASYVAAQSKVDALFAQPAAWAERALLNVAAMGEFSSDHTIAQYVDRVWSAAAVA